MTGSYTIQIGGVKGVDGSEIELGANSTHIRWRYVGDVAWTNLVALSAITGATGATGANGINPRGVYNSLTAYSVDDLVTNGGNAYVCIQASTGNNPSNVSYWTKYVSKGDTGDAGVSPTLVAGTGITIVESPTGTFTISLT